MSRCLKIFYMLSMDFTEFACQSLVLMVLVSSSTYVKACLKHPLARSTEFPAFTHFPQKFADYVHVAAVGPLLVSSMNSLKS